MKLGGHPRQTLPRRIMVVHLRHTKLDIMDPLKDINLSHRNHIIRTWVHQVNRHHHNKLLSSKHRLSQPNPVVLVVALARWYVSEVWN
jgi:hypothetical protein